MFKLPTLHFPLQFFQDLSGTFLKKHTRKSETSVHGSAKRGHVYLIGAGPGDPELITMKGWRILHSADVVLYDYLVAPELINELPKHSHKVFVGKKCGQHSMSQQEICELISKFALQGKSVARLKGGDPSIFGRASEELEHLNQLDIPVAIIPGITAASGCAAWSGLPLTQRNVAQGVRFITAHMSKKGKGPDWQNIAQSTDTVVFYMGLNQIETIAQQLMANGKAGDTPMAIIDQGTTAQHKVIQSNLRNIDDALSREELVGPALVMVGEALAFQHQIEQSLLTTQSQLKSNLTQFSDHFA